MEVAYFNQRQLAARWDISEAMFEGWRSEAIHGPRFAGGLVVEICHCHRPVRNQICRWSRDIAAEQNL